MKRKILIPVSVLVISMLISGCANGETETSSSVSSQPSSSVSSDVSEDNSVKESELLLMKSFGELWMSDNFYIDVIMTTRYDPSAVSNAVPDTSAVSSGSADTSDSGIVSVRYSYIIEADRVNDVAALNMISDRGNLCTIVRDNRIYTIDHSTKTYTSTPYEGTATDYAGNYTTKVCLGAVNNCTFRSTGQTQYEGKNVTFERYKLDITPSEDGLSPGIQGDTYVEYYFDSLGIPVAEVVQSSSGSITFDFVKISDKLEIGDMLEIPKDYKEADKTG